MTKRKILKDFVLTEISGVDRPAQPTAKMSIMKRAIDEANKEIVKSDKDLKDSIPPANPDVEKTSSGEAGIKAEPESKGEPDMLKTTDEGVAMSEVEDLKKQLEEAQTLAKMSDAEKMYMDGMDEKMKKEFMGLTPEERKKKMEMTKRDDETLDVDGVTISKSAVGADMFAVMKSQQAALESQKADIAKAQERAEMAELTKRASDEFSHLSGEASEVAMLLKHVEAMPEDVKKTALAVMKSAEEMNAKAFKSQGTTLAKSVDQTAEEEIDTLTKAYVEKNSVDYATAYTAVITANPELYKRINGQ